MHLRIDPVGDAVERSQLERRAVVQQDEVRGRAADQRDAGERPPQERDDRRLDARGSPARARREQQHAHGRGVEGRECVDELAEGLVAREPQRNLEPRAALPRECLCAPEDGQVAGLEVDAQVRGAQLEEADPVVLLLALVGREHEPDRRQRPARLAERHGCALHLCGRSRRPAGLDLDDLLEALALHRLVREAERQLGPVGLVRRVRPVALILELEEVALEAEAQRAELGELDLEPGERPDQRLRQPVDPRLRADLLGQRARLLAVCARQAIWLPDDPGERLQQAEPEAVVRERALRGGAGVLGVEPILHRAFVRSGQRYDGFHRGMCRSVLPTQRGSNRAGEAAWRKSYSGNRPNYSVLFRQRHS